MNPIWSQRTFFAPRTRIPESSKDRNEERPPFPALFFPLLPLLRRHKSLKCSLMHGKQVVRVSAQSVAFPQRDLTRHLTF